MSKARTIGNKEEFLRRLIAPCSLVALLSGCVTPSQASLSEPTLQQALPEALILPDADGTLVLADQHITPKDGELLRADLVLPEYERGTYFRAFTEFSGNQVSPIWFDDVSDILEFVPEPPRQISSFRARILWESQAHRSSMAAIWR